MLGFIETHTQRWCHSVLTHPRVRLYITEDKNGTVYVLLSLYSSANFTCDADRRWRSNNEIVISPTCIPGIAFAHLDLSLGYCVLLEHEVFMKIFICITIVCGQPTAVIPAYQRIIGGSEAPENTIPWQVLLSVDGQRAGGMVIADHWIMTAAHVLVHEGNVAPKESVRVSWLL